MSRKLRPQKAPFSEASGSGEEVDGEGELGVQALKRWFEPN